jgi:hypothetical protein
MNDECKKGLKKKLNKKKKIMRRRKKKIAYRNLSVNHILNDFYDNKVF